MASLGHPQQTLQLTQRENLQWLPTFVQLTAQHACVQVQDGELLYSRGEDVHALQVSLLHLALVKRVLALLAADRRGAVL
jgi:hypothetical protein